MNFVCLIRCIFPLRKNRYSKEVDILFYFILFYFILFFFLLFYFILFYFILFYFILFYFILFYFILFYFILFYFILFYFILFYFILFYFILFYFILFYFILFYFILFYFILFYFLLINSNFPLSPPSLPSPFPSSLFFFPFPHTAIPPLFLWSLSSHGSCLHFITVHRHRNRVVGFWNHSFSEN